MSKYLSPLSKNIFSLFTALTPRKTETKPQIHPQTSKNATGPGALDCPSLGSARKSIRSLGRSFRKRSLENSRKLRNRLLSSRTRLGLSANRKPDWAMPSTSPEQSPKNAFFLQRKEKRSRDKPRRSQSRAPGKLKERLANASKCRLPPLREKPRNRQASPARKRSKRKESRRPEDQHPRREKQTFKEKYKTTEVLGKGSNSNVYLSRSRKTKREFAVKIFKKSDLASHGKLRNLKVMSNGRMRSSACVDCTESPRLLPSPRS